jgi:hypothetical protein
VYRLVGSISTVNLQADKPISEEQTVSTTNDQSNYRELSGEDLSVFLYKSLGIEDRSPFLIGCRLCTIAGFGIIAGLLSIKAWAQPLIIFTSTGEQGHTRWSTQAMDNSYLPVPSLSSRDSIQDSSTQAQSHTTVQHQVIARRRQQWQPAINAAANRHDVDARWVTALIEIESGFNPKAVSPKGAIGLMQLMPATAARYGVRNARELFDPERNLDIGVRHLKDLLIAHEGNVALAMASYNAGSGAVAKHGKRIPRFNETMLYVPAVLAAIASYPPAEKP